MKKILFATVALIGMTFFTTQAQNKETKQNGPQISFDKTVHDYGTVVKGADGNCQFTFTNTGNEPLLLSNVSASCGCTSPSWTKDPVMPGKTGIIKVRYTKMGQPGSIGQSITVMSNAVNNDRVTLRITGKVVDEAEAVPQK